MTFHLARRWSLLDAEPQRSARLPALTVALLLAFASLVAKRAAEAFGWAVTETARRFGAFDAAWCDVSRVRIANVDVPVGGCPGALGCFRVLNFRTDADGKRPVTGGDGWVLAVEFGDVPRAYSVLAYGNSNRPESPLYGNQAEMFARGEMKRVQWLENDILAGTVERYRPGVER